MQQRSKKAVFLTDSMLACQLRGMLNKWIHLNELKMVYTLFPLQKYAFGGSLRATSMQGSINDPLIYFQFHEIFVSLICFISHKFDTVTCWSQDFYPPPILPFSHFPSFHPGLCWSLGQNPERRACSPGKASSPRCANKSSSTSNRWPLGEVV